MIERAKFERKARRRVRGRKSAAIRNNCPKRIKVRKKMTRKWAARRKREAEDEAYCRRLDDK